jgi:hypothetical protein
MQHPDIMRFMVDERIDDLRHAARRRPAHTIDPVDEQAVELRLCRVDDDPALEQLAALEGRELPAGRFVLAEVAGRVVAALPLAGGPALRDPFVPTKHLERLLELRAAQLEPARRSRPFGFAVARLRRA